MSDSELFRQRAVIAHTDTQFGAAVIHQPLRLRVLVSATVSLVLVFLVYAGSVSINRSERVRGFLVPVDGEVRLYPSRSGIIHTLNVSDGALVKSGDVLAVIMNPLTDYHGAPALPELLAHLEDQMGLLNHRAEILGKRSALNSNALSLSEQTLEREIELLREDSKLLQQRMLLGEQEHDANRSLYQQGLLSQREYNQSASSSISLQQSVNNAELNIAAREQRLQDVRDSYALQRIMLEEDQLTLQLNIVQLRAQQQELLVQHKYSMLAPKDGQVSKLGYTSGDRVEPAMALLSVLGENPTLEAHMYLPSRAVGQIRKGQNVQLSYDAFPVATFGSFSAVVTSIALTPLDPREFLLAVDIREPVFLVKAALGSDHDANPDVLLRAGFQFAAYITTDRSSLMRRLVSPFLTVSRKL